MNDVATEPNAFLVGVAKAGTTALASQLALHPEIFVPETKEPNYQVLRHGPLSTAGPAPAKVIDFLLHRFSVAETDAYRQLYAAGADAAIRMDASVRYLYHPSALESIARDYPAAPIIVVLRDPTDRAISHWRMMREYALEPLDLSEALEAEDRRVAAGWGYDWHYHRLGRYSEQLETLFGIFPSDRVLVTFYGDLVRHPGLTLQRCHSHLDVDTPLAESTIRRAKVTTEPRSEAITRALTHPTKIRRLLRSLPGGPWLVGVALERNARAPRPVPPAVVDELRAAYRTDLLSTAELLKMTPQDLDHKLGRRPTCAVSESR